MIRCLSCNAETTNGLALCERCRHTFTVACVNTAAYFTDVDRIRPGRRVKVRAAYQSTPPPDTAPAPDPIGEALDHVATIVFGWSRNLEDDRPGLTMPSITERRIGWLESHGTTIATLEWAGECLRELRDCERMLRRILDRSDTGEYAGVCGNEIGREDTPDGPQSVTCERHLYSTARSSWVTCPECGRSWDAKGRREVMLAHARQELAPVRTIARVVVQLTDEPSAERLTRRIEQWVQRKQLRDYGVRVLDGKPKRVYRIDDVLKLVTGEMKPKDAAAC